MKKILSMGIVVAVLITGFLLYRQYVKQPEQPVIVRPAVQPEAAKATVTLELNDGTGIATYSGITAATAYEALQAATEAENLPLVTKEYDFGTFVEKIGDKESDRNMAWIYFVNGTSGEIAADKYKLAEGDTVEWRYTKPEY